MATSRSGVGIAFSAIVFLAPGVSRAEVPTPTDIASCNEQAKQTMHTASASPRTDTAGGVVTVGAAAAPTPPPAGAGTPPTPTPTPTEADPQLQGIDPEGEKDPAYIAAYKTCMRQHGF